MSEIVFSIDAKETFLHNKLTIRLYEAEKIGFSFSIIAPLKPTLGSELKRFNKNKGAIEELIKEEIQFQKHSTGRSPHADTTLFTFFHVSLNQSISILELLSETQKLFFNNKHLSPDFFGKVNFSYLVEALSEKKVRVSGRLKWQNNIINLSDCCFVGPGKPNWFIKGLSLKLISTDIAWNKLKKLYEGKTIELDGMEKSLYFEDVDKEDPDAPQIEFVNGTTENLRDIPDPLPILKLKDRSGAFADLFMNYGNGIIIEYQNPLKDLKDPSGKKIGIRNLEAEKGWEKDLFETDYIRKDVSTSKYYCPLDKVAKSLSFLLELGWELQDINKKKIVKQDSFDLSVDYTEKNLTVKGKVNYENFQADISQVIGSFNKRERFIQLNDGHVGLLPDRWQESELQELAEESELIQGHLKIKRNAIGNTQSLLKNSNATPALQNLKERLQNFTKIEKALPGENFKGILRPYQQEGLNWLSFLADYDFHGMLADDMGLGKTVQVLAFLSRLRLEKPCLIVMPTSLLFNWKKEIEKFLPNISFCIHHGIKRAKTKEELTTYSIILTSYSTLRMDLLLFQKIPLQALILDEAQAIKNSNTQTAQSVYSLQADFRLSITGTPIENHLNELWSQFHFLIPDLFEDQSQFNADLQAAAVDSRYLQKIRKKVAPFILRRKKEEVAKDLPERIDQIVWLQMPEEQQSIYDQFLAGVKSGLLKKIEIDGLAKHRIAVFEAILRLRQICCHPLLIPSFLDEDTPLPPSIKIDSLFQDLETIVEEKGKVLIYSQFTSMLQIMAKESKNRGWKFVYLDGSTTNREKVIDSFQNDPEVSLFFISLKAGGVGLNLTAADYVFIYDPWWNDAVEEQAINRAHRIGRTKTVFTKKFITLQSIEEKMMKLKEAKKDLFNQIMDEEIHMQNLTLDDLKYLLE